MNARFYEKYDLEIGLFINNVFVATELVVTKLSYKESALERNQDL